MLKQKYEKERYFLTGRCWKLMWDIECPQSQILIEEIYLTGTLIQPLAKPMAKITKGVDMPNMIM